ncbi:CZB domain-containing protein [Thiolapillus sp.]
MQEKKKELIGKLRDAKKAHRRWVSNAQILMQGVPVKNDQLPLNETECGFGHWYYGEGQALRSYPVYRNIEAPHTALHTTYLQIFDLLFRERKVSLFSRMLGKKAEPSPAELESARRLFTVLNAESLKIMELLDELEDLIVSMDDKDFENLF